MLFNLIMFQLPLVEVIGLLLEVQAIINIFFSIVVPTFFVFGSSVRDVVGF